MAAFIERVSQAADLRNHAFRMLVGGELESGSGTFASIDPATEDEIAQAPAAAPEHVRRAVSRAVAAQPAWAARPFEERRAVVLEIASALRRHSAAFGLIDTLENGNVLSAMQRDAAYAAHRMEYLASVAYEVKGHVTSLDADLHYTRRQPYGVVVRLLPFNHPIASAGVALAAPLLMGNAVILKPSPHTSLSALTLGELIHDLVPAGIVGILSGPGHAVAEALVREPGVSRVSLTGSVSAGSAVMKLASERLIPLTLELGGKNPLIVFPDADVDRAVAVAVAGMNFKWQGHSCGSTSRILLHRSLREPFLEQLGARLVAIRVASPLDPAAEMGAISFRDLYERCLFYVRQGKEEGATLLAGGTRPDTVAGTRGFFLRPTLFADVAPSMRIARDEIFGPILSVLEWEDEGEMVATANELDLGLTGVILTNDITRALRTADALQCGYVEINGNVSHPLGAPFGGVKASGFGREGGIEELESYTRGKSVNVRLSS